MVSRLRPLPLLAWIIVTQSLAAVFWALGFLLTLNVRSERWEGFDFTSDVFRETLAEHGQMAGFIAFMIVAMLHWLIVYVKGTFVVAAGVARETQDGMLEGQRLTPLPNGHKIIGQWLGLPVQEHVIGGLLMLWFIPSWLIGGLPVLMFIQLGLLTMTSALMHHGIGLICGTVIQQKILAGTLSQLLLFVLYVLFPLAGYFGVGAITHLSASDAFLSIVSQYLPFEGFAQSEVFNWFGRPIPIALYTWILMVLAIIAFAAIMYRRWNDPDALLLGKRGTLGAAAVLLVFTLGEFHDYQPTLKFNSSAGPVKVNVIVNGEIDTSIESYQMVEVIGWITGFATVLGLLALFFTTIIAPSKNHRALFRHAIRLRPWHDGAPTLPWVAAICLMTFATFYAIQAQMSDRLEGLSMSSMTLPMVAIALLIPSATWLLAVTSLGWRIALVLAFVLSILPLPLAALVFLITGDLTGSALWIFALSGISMPGMAWFLGSTNHYDLIYLIPFLGSMVIHAGFSVWLLCKYHVATLREKPENDKLPKPSIRI
jgi:hypothetical protein